MKSNFSFLLLAALFAFLQAVASAQTTITYDVTARIDVADLLLIRGSEARWQHPGRGAVRGWMLASLLKFPRNVGQRELHLVFLPSLLP